MKDTVRQILVVVAVVLTLVVNGLAGTTVLNGQTTGEVSDKYPGYFTPPGYVFAIWGVIYLGLILYAIYQALPAQRENGRLRAIGYLFVLSCLVNVAWLLFWQYEIMPVTMVLMLALLGLLIAIYLRLGTGRSPAGLAEKLLVRLPFSIYLGWISVATIANVTVLLVSLGVKNTGTAAEVWTLVVLAAGLLLGAATSLLRADVAYSLVLIWAFVGIALKPSVAPAGLITPLVSIAAWVTAGLVLVMLVVGVALRMRRRPAA
jgi:tryptophan-rich sensory protein